MCVIKIFTTPRAFFPNLVAAVLYPHIQRHVDRAVKWRMERPSTHCTRDAGPGLLTIRAHSYITQSAGVMTAWHNILQFLVHELPLACETFASEKFPEANQGC